MIKRYFPVVLVLCFFCMTAQVKTGRIQYGLKFDFEDDLKQGPMASYVASAEQAAKYVTFNLDFNENEMIFYQDDSMALDGQNLSFALAFSGGNGTFYRTKNSSTMLNEVTNEMFGNIIIRSEISTKWVLTSESKKINDFLCYKATSTLDIDNGESGKFSFPVIAWYCPAIPVPFGPRGYGGLPGLILELQERNILFGVKKMDLKPSAPIKIEKPHKGKLVTSAEFSKMSEEYAKKQE